MQKNKKIILIIVIISIILLIIGCFGIILYKNIRSTNTECCEEEQNDEIDAEVLALIDNSEYYQEKVKEYDEITQKYEDLATKYKNECFSGEEIEKLKNLEIKMKSTNNKEEKIQFSHERAALFKEYIKKELTDEQINELETLENKIDELEVITNEFCDKVQEATDILSKQGLKTLSDGNILNQRESMLSTKEYDGIEFSEIELVYNPNTKASTLKMKAKNTTNEVKGNELVKINFIGKRTNGMYPIQLDEILPGEYTDLEIQMADTDYSDTDSFEVVKN